MGLESSHIAQLIVTVLACIIVLVAAYAAPLKISVGILLVLIPFQPVETAYFTANALMTFVIFTALMLRQRLQFAPMIGAMLAVLFAYLITMSQLNKELYVAHGLQVIFLVSGLLVFVLAYNLAREVESPRYVVNLLVASNVLAVIYCLIQFAVGPGERLLFFGLEELSMHRNRGGGDPRLVGPFGSPTITSAYFMSMIVILAYEILHSHGFRRVAVIFLATLNLGMLMATGNRGSFLVLVASLLIFLYVFRVKIGVARAVQIFVASVIVVVGVGITLATHTEFGQLIDRLEGTTTAQGALPDTRQRIWPETWAVIPNRMWLGHGPRIMPPGEVERRGTVHPEQLVNEYPHNLFLYLLLTVGIVGTVCMFFFLLGTAWRIYQVARRERLRQTYEAGLAALGSVVVLGVLVDQFKVEFLRHSSIDYAHFVFMLFGIFLGFADRQRRRQSSGSDIPVIRTRAKLASPLSGSTSS
jgi:O-antigen ligase